MKLATFTYGLVVATTACFALSYGASLAGGLNSENPYPDSVAKRYARTGGATRAVDFTRDFPAEGLRTLDLRTVAVDVVLEPSATARVTTHLKAELPVERDDAALEAVPENGTLTLRTVESREGNENGFHFSFSDAGGGTLRVGVPAGVREVMIKTVSGNQKITGVRLAALRAKTVSGDAHLADARVETLEFNSVSGNLEAAGDLAQVNGHSVSGNFRFRFENPHPTASLSTISGDSRVAFHAIPSLRVSFNTVSGSFAVDKRFAANEFDGRKVAFTLGDGAGLLDAKSTSGDVKLEQY